MKVDLVHSDRVVDAEDVLASNIHEAATHPVEVDMPVAAISEIDVTEEFVGDDFSVVTADDDLIAISDDSASDGDAALVTAVDETTATNVTEGEEA